MSRLARVVLSSAMAWGQTAIPTPLHLPSTVIGGRSGTPEFETTSDANMVHRVMV